jgi:alpha-N-arabinofuranosidase
LEFFIQDALDAIEYAIGDVNTALGAKRAAAGHPKPFPLKYVQIGNENHGPMYEMRYNKFYTRLKAAYPQIEMIFNGVATGAGSVEVLNPKFNVDKIEIADYHWYDGPDWFYDHAFLFDKIQPRHNFKIYVGEYACHRKVGTGNMFGALSEAAFIMGMERNSDLVTMTSYAPLIENSNGRKWPVNMMMLNNHQVVGRSSYYVQKMYAQNRPSYNLETHLLNDKGMAVDTLDGMRQYAQAGYNEQTKEIIVKVVNATSDVFSPQIFIQNSPKLKPVGEMISLSANDPTDENSFETPQKVIPKTEQIKIVSEQFYVNFAPWSFSIIKLTCK